MKTSVVIPNWQGRELLEKNLPAVMTIGADEVIVTDDGSSDGSVEFIEKKFPKIRIIKHPKRLGFSKNVNSGVASATGDIIVLLNTDVLPKKGLLESVLPHFKDPGIFAVSFNEEKWGPARGVFYRGFIEHRPGKKTKIPTASFWASGGSAAYDREKWNILEGLDAIYDPFYWEDIDLSYRAQKRGWRVVWEPNAHVAHEHEGTISKLFSYKRRQWVIDRNQILFFWLNISSPEFWSRHLFWLFVRLLRPGYWIPFIWAILKLPQVLVRRVKGTAGEISDEEILERFKK